MLIKAIAKNGGHLYQRYCVIQAKEGIERKVREEILNRAIKYNESQNKTI